MDEGCEPKKTFVGEDDFSELQKKKFQRMRNGLNKLVMEDIKKGGNT